MDIKLMKIGIEDVLRCSCEIQETSFPYLVMVNRP